MLVADRLNSRGRERSSGTALRATCPPPAAKAFSLAGERNKEEEEEEEEIGYRPSGDTQATASSGSRECISVHGYSWISTMPPGSRPHLPVKHCCWPLLRSHRSVSALSRPQEMDTKEEQEHAGTGTLRKTTFVSMISPRKSIADMAIMIRSSSSKDNTRTSARERQKRNEETETLF